MVSSNPDAFCPVSLVQYVLYLWHIVSCTLYVLFPLLTPAFCPVQLLHRVPCTAGTLYPVSLVFYLLAPYQTLLSY